MLTYKVRSTLEKPLKPLSPYIIKNKLTIIQFMLTRHIQFMSNILFFLCCLFKYYLCIQFNFSLCLVGLSFKKLTSFKMIQKILRPTTAINCGMMQEDWEGSDWQGKYLLALISTKFQFSLNICCIFGLIIWFFHIGVNIC